MDAEEEESDLSWLWEEMTAKENDQPLVRRGGHRVQSMVPKAGFQSTLVLVPVPLLRSGRSHFLLVWPFSSSAEAVGRPPIP